MFPKLTTPESLRCPHASNANQSPPQSQSLRNWLELQQLDSCELTQSIRCEGGVGDTVGLRCDGRNEKYHVLGNKITSMKELQIWN